MKLEIKKIKLGSGSQETIQFTGELHINGKLVAFLNDGGYGGEIEIQIAAFYEEGKEKEFKEKQTTLLKLLEDAEKYCKALPPVQPSEEEKAAGFDKPLKMDLQFFMSIEVNKIYNAKNRKYQVTKEMARLTRLCNLRLVILSKKQVEDFISGASNDYPIVKTITMKKPFHVYNQEQLKQFIKDKILPQLKGDEYLFNTNIPKLD